MATLTEMVAAVVVHSSAVAFSHFGVSLEAPQAEPTQSAPGQTAPSQTGPSQIPSAHVVARTPRKVEKAAARRSGARAPEAKA